MIIRVSVPNLFLDKNTSQYKLLIYKILRCEILRFARFILNWDCL